MKKKILFITNVNPFAASFGAEQRSYVLLCAFLQNNCSVDVAYVGTTNEDSSKCPQDVNIVYWNNGKQWRFSRKARIFSLLAFRIFPVSFELESIIDSIVRSKNYDFITCRYIPIASFAGLDKYADRLILDIDDLPEQSILVSSVSSNLFRNFYIWVKSRSIQLVTKRWIKRSNVCFLPNKSLAEKYRCEFLPNIPIFSVDAIKVNTNNKNILFVGLMSYAPNYEGVNHFIRYCWNKILLSVPDAHLLIAGKGLSSQLQKEWEQFNNVEVLGFVDDINEFYSKGNIVVVPVFQGSGTNIKVIESFAQGKATILSQFSMRGFEEIVEQNINAYVALNDDEFVQYSVSLLQNVELVGRIAVNALIKANYFYSQESVNKIIKCSLV